MNLQETIAAMTLEQKIGQLFMVPTASSLKESQDMIELLASRGHGCPYNLDHDYIHKLIRDYHIGGLIFLYANAPDAQVECINKFNSESAIPLLIGLDAEWGPAMRHACLIKFPRNMTLAAVNDPELIRKLGKLIGRQLKLIGVHINFAPVVDVNNNPENPVIHDRSFGDDKERVAQLAIAFMQGMQESGVLACCKHFPGHGDTNVDSHIGLPTIVHAKEHLEEIELYPFKKLIEAGVDAIMLAHLLVPALDALYPSSLSRCIIIDLLQKQLGFEGLVVTDGLGMKAITDLYPDGQAELHAILAGNDMIVCPTNVEQAVIEIKRAIYDGRLTEAEIDRRVLKILRVKEKMRLATKKVEAVPEVSAINSPEALALKQQLYTQAITYVGDPKTLESITPESHCVVQLGTDELTPLATQLQNNGFKIIHTHKKMTEEILKEISPYAGVIVALYGITKYAQQSYGLSSDTLEILYVIQQQKKTLPIIFGTPYSMRLLESTDAIIAYENDSDAQKGVADILLHTHKPTGILPVALASIMKPRICPIPSND